MLAPLTSLSPCGVPGSGGGLGLPHVAGPLVTLAFTLPLAGPVPSDLELDAPQSCQNSVPNVVLQVTVVDQDEQPIDVSAATSLQFWLRAPDGSPRPVPAAFASNGLDGKIQYVTSAEDLPEAGRWSLQAQLTFQTQVLLTRWASFRAKANIVDGPQEAA